MAVARRWRPEKDQSLKTLRDGMVELSLGWRYAFPVFEPVLVAKQPDIY
jgi:hypothetical protein